MKKSLLSLAIFSLVFVAGGFVLAQAQGEPGFNPGQRQPNRSQNNQPPADRASSTLEKISNPGQISLFEKIQKIGTSLFGIRKQLANKKLDQKNSEQSPAASNASSTLEKISNPAEISLFDKIKKIGTALWGVRKNNNQKQNNNQLKPVYVTAAAASCVSGAIDKKDAALKVSQANHAQSVSSAIDTRGTCQKTALSQTTAKTQADANKICLKAFQAGVNEINKTIAAAKQSTFATYKTDLKSCSTLQVASTATSTSEIQSEQIMIPDEITSEENETDSVDQSDN